MINISTGGLNLSISKILNEICSHDIDYIELSGGKYEAGQEEKIISFSGKRNLSLHNYCLIPQVPFVLNLSSCNNIILEKSIQHIKKCIKITAALGSSNFSFHAGYMFDPMEHELGNDFTKSKVITYPNALENFLIAVHEIFEYSQRFGIKIFIENNVITKSNYNKFKQDVLLMTSPERIHEVLYNIPSEIGLLMDVGHLKVSANTLGFDKEECLRSLSTHLPIAYHLSENNGFKDSNIEFDENSWFIKYLSSNRSFITIEVYDKSLIELNNFRYNLMKKKVL